MNIRKAAVADKFYPGDAHELRHLVEQYLSQTQVKAAPDSVAAIIAPHAGYVYSGPTAGFAYARARGKTPKRVILLGCSHQCGINRASVFDEGAFETPLGVFPIDEPFAKRLAEEWKSAGIEPHLGEHSLEVQLPFLSVALGETETPIVPILFGGPAGSWHVAAGETLARLADDSDLVVVSTDLSHYLSDEEAHQLDKQTLDTVLTRNCESVIQGLARGACSMCGGAAVVAAMAFARARNAIGWSLLDYRTSAAISKDYRRVVGYAALSMELEP